MEALVQAWNLVTQFRNYDWKNCHLWFKITVYKCGKTWIVAWFNFFATIISYKSVWKGQSIFDRAPNVDAALEDMILSTYVAFVDKRHKRGFVDFDGLAVAVEQGDHEVEKVALAQIRWRLFGEFHPANLKAEKQEK